MRPKLILITALAAPASSLLVTTGSPCSQYCGNVLSSTTGSDMTCSDSGYAGSAAGTVFETCVDCELQSTYSYDNQTDLQWLLYNTRYAVSYCLFGKPNNTDVEDNPCITDPACGLLLDSFYYKNLSTDTGAYDYCDNWVETSVSKCSACLRSGSYDYTNNFVTILDAACQQKPAVGSTVSVDGTPFSTTPMNITAATPTPSYTYTPSHSPISLGGKVGIAVGGLVFLLSALGCTIVCLGRRRRRDYLKSVASRHENHGWPSQPGVLRTHDFTDTPMSQKPLRGWDNSPISASTDNGLFPRYFSPYSSQYNSPVSAVDAKNQPWPVAAFNGFMDPTKDPGLDNYNDPGIGSSSGHNAQIHQSSEEIERSADELQLASVGVAMGGPDPSLRTRASNANVGEQAQPYFAETPVTGKGKGRRTAEESYELREIDSNGLPTEARSAQVPIIQHPGYGRGRQTFPLPPAGPASPYGMTGMDGKEGNAI